uniref:Uncharacterized protein n=1 Tax=Oryza punctata TaxID=4537 RepID=A0A0E0LMG8_ORYPU
MECVHKPMSSSSSLASSDVSVSGVPHRHCELGCDFFFSLALSLSFTFRKRNGTCNARLVITGVNGPRVPVALYIQKARTDQERKKKREDDEKK